MNTVLVVFVVLLLAKFAAEGALEFLNRRHVRAYAGNPPEACREIMDDTTYRKSVNYTLAKSRLGMIESGVSTAVLLLLLPTGWLAAIYGLLSGWIGEALWLQPSILIGIGLLLALPELPLDWWAQFRLEERFGFNKSTPRIWWTDKVKGALVGVVLYYPLLLALLWIVETLPRTWWLWGFVLVFGFMLAMMVIYPMFIMPLFNRFDPLPEGSLRRRLIDLADRARFPARTILVMDGSRRSRHSNAFFTGFGRFRRIVLYDTLVEQMEEEELEAVLAHEIGHYKLRHIPRLLGVSAVFLLLGFWAMGMLLEAPWFAGAFGFAWEAGQIVPVLLLFSLLAGLITFWFTPLFSHWSRTFEYEADNFAREAIGSSKPLVRALRKLHRENLSNLTPHPIYSRVYYSHPTLVEREAALRNS